MAEGRKYVSDEGVRLLVLAQSGDRNAESDLVDLICRTFMGRRIGRYISKNRQADNDDIRQEFAIGVGKGIHKAKLDVGDPIEYLIWLGTKSVASYMRSCIKKGTEQVCGICGFRQRLNPIEDGYMCTRCGSTNVTTHEVNEHDEFILENIPADEFEDKIMSDIIMTKFEQTLTPGTNTYDLYNLLKSGIDRDNPLVKNYIKEIATIWGCSDQNVVRNMDKLKVKFKKFLDDNQIGCLI